MNECQFSPRQFPPCKGKVWENMTRIIIERVIIITYEWGLPHHKIGMRTRLARDPRQKGNFHVKWKKHLFGKIEIVLLC